MEHPGSNIALFHLCISCLSVIFLSDRRIFCDKDTVVAKSFHEANGCHCIRALRCKVSPHSRKTKRSAAKRPGMTPRKRKKRKSGWRLVTERNSCRPARTRRAGCPAAHEEHGRRQRAGPPAQKARVAGSGQLGSLCLLGGKVEISRYSRGRARGSE